MTKKWNITDVLFQAVENLRRKRLIEATNAAYAALARVMNSNPAFPGISNLSEGQNRLRKTSVSGKCREFQGLSS